jgi:hypothetical protein
MSFSMTARATACGMAIFLWIPVESERKHAC